MQNKVHIPRKVEERVNCPDTTSHHQIHFCCNSLVKSGESAGLAQINWVFVLLWSINSFISFALGSWQCLSLPPENVDGFTALTLLFSSFIPFNFVSFLLASVGSLGEGLQNCLRETFCLDQSCNRSSVSFSVCYSLCTLFWL